MSKCYRSELVGTFGNPIDENPTGVVMEAGFKAAGLDYRYITMKVEPQDLKAAMEGMKAVNMRGINLTIPFKVEGVKYLDELSPAAEIIGAVNIVVNDGGKLWGENTDGKGLLTSFKNEGVSARGKNITVLGAGGASRAICVECALAGAKKITIANIVKEQGEELAGLIRSRTGAEAEFIFWDHPITVPEDTDILVNATSVGLFPNVNDKPDIDYDSVKGSFVVSDVIFNDPRTLFLAEAKKRGAKTINGLGMLVNQAALNFKLWTGVEAPIDVMTETLRNEFGL
ncbi:MAG: shikimate dehydrogenase [Oscillospiraceae bacterium]